MVQTSKLNFFQIEQNISSHFKVPAVPTNKKRAISPVPKVTIRESTGLTQIVRTLKE